MVRIQVVFIGKNQWEAGWPHLGYDNSTVINNLIDHLKEKFSDIDFNINDLVYTYNKELISEIKRKINESDGVIIFTIGHYGDPGLITAGVEFIEFGKPVVLANIIYGGDHTFTKINAIMKDKSFPFHIISSQNHELFDKPIGILCDILKLKGEKVLVYASDDYSINWDRVLGFINPERKNLIKNHPKVIQELGKMSKDKDFEFYTDTAGLDQAHQWRRDEELYRKNLKKIFGIEMIIEEPDQILTYYDEINKEEAEEIAQKWINKAKKVGPTEKTILNSAKLYLAFKKILNEKNIKYFTPDCGSLLLSGKIPAYPCLSFMQLYMEGIYGTCESDMDSLVSFLFGLVITGRPGYVSNHTFDTTTQEITYLHCVAPINYYGNTNQLGTYDIVYHGESHYVGACPRVEFPIGEVVTTIKISIFNRRIELRKGEIIDNIINEGGCVSKMLVKSQVNKILENYDWESFGWHRVTFIGDWKDEFIIGANLLGLEVVDLS